jgi:hypothetical protein
MYLEETPCELNYYTESGRPLCHRSPYTLALPWFIYSGIDDSEESF